METRGYGWGKENFSPEVQISNFPQRGAFGLISKGVILSQADWSAGVRILLLHARFFIITGSIEFFVFLYQFVFSWFIMKHQSIYNRLRRIEGQIRGIEEMIAKDRPTEEIFVQLAAAKSSLSSTLSAFIESLLEQKDSDSKISLTAEQIRLILRSIK